MYDHTAYCDIRKVAFRAGATWEQKHGTAGLRWAAEQIPTNWCDPMLTGPDRVSDFKTSDCRDIERVLLAVQACIRREIARREAGEGGGR